MPYLEHHPVDYFPRHLLQDEIADPRLAIRRIFDEELNMVDARKWLDKWLNTLFGEKQVLGRKFIVLLMDLQEALLKLLEAAYLLQLEDPSLHKEVSITVMKGTGLPVPSLYCGLTHKEYTAWDYFPRHLTRKEFTDPYRVFEKLCRYKHLPEWRDTLQNFFSAAVSGARIYECCQDSNVYLTGKYLLKLVEAVHLVNVRES
jgi:hypothetical protein